MTEIQSQAPSTDNQYSTLNMQPTIDNHKDIPIHFHPFYHMVLPSGKGPFSGGGNVENKKVINSSRISVLQLLPRTLIPLRTLFLFFSPPKGGKKTVIWKNAGGGSVDWGEEWPNVVLGIFGALCNPPCSQKKYVGSLYDPPFP
jgi:hypothetical protein